MFVNEDYVFHIISSLSLCVFSEFSLTSENLSTVLDIMEDWMWYEFGRYVNIPESELDKIRSQCSSDRECKQAVIVLFISKHPSPSWTLVAHTLYKIGGWYSDDVSCLKSLDLLQQLFPTGTIIYICIYSLYILIVNPRCTCPAGVTLVGLCVRPSVHTMI